MQYSITPEGCQAAAQGNSTLALLENWEQLVRSLPVDLEATARATRALCRRRQVQSAPDLLRLILAYAVCDWPLRLVATWYALRGSGRLSKTAVRQRLQHSVAWMGTLVAALLPRPVGKETAGPAARLRLVDATVISRPGSTGTDWRVHLCLDLGEDRIAGVEVTDAHGAETLARFPVQPREIRLGDRGYAFASGLGPVLQAEGWVVVRLNWQSLPLENKAGQREDVIAWLKGWPPALVTPQEQLLWLPTKQGRFSMRLIARPLAPEQAEAARRRARQAARKKKHTVDARTLLAAGFVLLLTNLPAEDWSGQHVLDLYRLRWQIELRIKRLKSVLDLDGLRAQDPALAQAYLLGKLLGALLIEAMQQPIRQQHPDWWTDTQRPLNRWQLTRLAGQVLADLVCGPLPWSEVFRASGTLRRLLCDEPRHKRTSQEVTGRRLLHDLSSC